MHRNHTMGSFVCLRETHREHNLSNAVHHMVQKPSKITQNIIKCMLITVLHKTEDSISSHVKCDACVPEADVDVALRLL